MSSWKNCKMNQPCKNNFVMIKPKNNYEFQGKYTQTICKLFKILSSSKRIWKSHQNWLSGCILGVLLLGGTRKCTGVLKWKKLPIKVFRKCKMWADWILSNLVPPWFKKKTKKPPLQSLHKEKSLSHFRDHKSGPCTRYSTVGCS